MANELTEKKRRILLEGTELSHPAQSVGAKVKKDWNLLQEVDVRLAICELKKRINDRQRYSEGWARFMLQDIDTCFPLFAEKVKE